MSPQRVSIIRMGNVAIIEAPSVLGLKETGVDQLPDALLAAGLASRLAATRAGRVEPPRYSPLRNHTHGMLNAESIHRYAPSDERAGSEGRSRLVRIVPKREATRHLAVPCGAKPRVVAGIDLTMVAVMKIVVSDPEILGGTPVFVGTRVPVKTLTDYLEAGDSIDAFLDDFPSVTREQVIAFLEEARERVIAAGA